MPFCCARVAPSSDSVACGNLRFYSPWRLEAPLARDFDALSHSSAFFKLIEEERASTCFCKHIKLPDILSCEGKVGVSKSHVTLASLNHCNFACHVYVYIIGIYRSHLQYV